LMCLRRLEKLMLPWKSIACTLRTPGGLPLSHTTHIPRHAGWLAGYSTGGGSANIGAVSTLIYELDTPFSGGSNLAGKDPRPRIFFDTPHAFLVT